MEQGFVEVKRTMRAGSFSVFHSTVSFPVNLRCRPWAYPNVLDLDSCACNSLVPISCSSAVVALDRRAIQSRTLCVTTNDITLQTETLKALREYFNGPINEMAMPHDMSEKYSQLMVSGICHAKSHFNAARKEYT